MNCPNHPADVSALSGLYGQVDPEVLRRDLAALPDALGALLADAANRPTPERLQACAYQLDGARLLVLRLAALQAEEAGDEAA